MYQHHQQAIAAITAKLQTREDVLGVIIGGSVAHGYASETSDLDIMLVLSEADYERALGSYEVGFFETESTPYEGGYVDGKCVSVDYIRQVAAAGSEPAKFAFKDAWVSYSRIEGLDELVAAASAYPSARQDENLARFYAQFETWKWYYYEGLKRNNLLLMDYSRTNYAYFAGRLILTLNGMLFPSYKWFLKELERAPRKPDGFMQLMKGVTEQRTAEPIEALYASLMDFHRWSSSDKHWSVQFMLDSQLNWLDGNVPILDL
ncbi:nucleotidyltransferase domain-containing protein [Paenibacillus tepidiphilus]|uniref:nucleotidyltransferase domain-containing protein n=1 Tax=Paenibacillus tepidiphilus TaxID=2608683 RepID=UPI00123AF6AC|nr:nucleotidyltransferase domain-containing protein [Paenibacillus tepidiphilus]